VGCSRTACIVSTHRLGPQSPGQRDYGYKCVHVSDPHAKRWLADDPGFLASLKNLDRGLSGDQIADEAGEDVVAAPSTAAAPPALASRTAPPIVTRQTPVSPPVGVAVHDTFAAAADSPPLPPPLAVARPPSAEPRTRRPLLDLFPPSALEAERPPLSLPGTAVGPELPPRSRPAPSPGPPSPLDGLTYETFYGLREKPFSLSTDPRFLYQSAAYDRASQEVLGAIRKHGGPAVLTAPLGLGKTTLCRSLIEEIDRRTVTSLILEPVQSLDDLIKTMLVDFGVIAREDLARASHLSREQMTATLNRFLESLPSLQASAMVLIDEAQNAPVALLGDLAVLLGGPAARALQLVLVGQPSLTALLEHADLRALNASVARRTVLGPLAADEIAGYVMHRLSIAGANTRIEFGEAAIARLYTLSEGAPRIVNLLCDRAMARGQAVSAGVIGSELIEMAAGDLDLEIPDEGPGLWTFVLVGLLYAVLVVVGAAAALWVSRDAVARTIQQWENVPLPPASPIRRLEVPLAPVPPPAEIPSGLPADRTGPPARQGVPAPDRPVVQDAAR
jgi:type II secretory pathway predicted ATPase ExeA